MSLQSSRIFNFHSKQVIPVELQQVRQDSVELEWVELSSRGLLPKMTACKTKTKSPWLGTIRGTQSFVCYSTQQNTSSFRVTASIYRYGDISKRLGSLFIFSLLLLHSPSLPHPNSLPHFSLRPPAPGTDHSERSRFLSTSWVHLLSTAMLALVLLASSLACLWLIITICNQKYDFPCSGRSKGTRIFY